MTAPPFASAPFGVAFRDLLSNTELWVVVGLLVTVLFAGGLVLWFVDRWRKQQPDATREAMGSLTSFRAMYEQGELSDEEYQKLRTRTAGQMTAAPPPAPPDPPPTPHERPDADR